MWVRYAVGAALGGVVTIMLLYIMQAVITSDRNPLNEAPPGAKIEFVRLLEDESPDLKTIKPKPPPPPEEMPPDLDRPDVSVEVDGEGFSLDGPQIVIDINVSGSGYSTDGEYLPIVQVEPVYPRRAASRGIEGFVLMTLTVTEQGTVRDVKVIEAQPENMFEKAAVAAALKNKYKPRIVDGRPITVVGVPYKITFEMEDAR